MFKAREGGGVPGADLGEGTGRAHPPFPEMTYGDRLCGLLVLR